MSEARTQGCEQPTADGYGLIFQPADTVNPKANATVHLVFLDNVSDLPVFDYRISPDPGDGGFWKPKAYRKTIDIDFPAIYVPGCTLRLSIPAGKLPVFVDAVHLIDRQPSELTVEFSVFQEITDNPIVVKGTLHPIRQSRGGADATQGGCAD